MEVVDAHVHFWDPAVLDYAWLGDAPDIHRAYLPADYSEASAGVEVTGLVFVEADCHSDQALSEVSWIETLAASESRLKGIVAAASMENGLAVKPHLQALQEHPLVKGVRRLIQSEDAGFCTTPEFIRAAQLLPEFDFTFDLCIKHPQCPDILTLVKACPETSFVLDHIGKPAIAERRLDPWRAHIDALAAMPQIVACKLSGLITEADWKTWTLEDLKPYLSHVIDAFGPDRLLYGSDWPVSVLAGGYARWWKALSTTTQTSFDDNARSKVFSGNARRVYRL
ncbi:MAG: L-fuconolactonase [Verrucomicrobiales bacterium]|jgi:L-fuconolactonase